MKRLSFQLMRSCGIFALARMMSAKMPRILMYHNFCGAGEIENGAIDTKLLRKQFDLLACHFQVVRLEELATRLQSGKDVGQNWVAITVDDGRRNFYEFAFPLLKEFRFAATFFVVSSFIGAQQWIWTDKVLWLAEQPNRVRELAGSNLDAAFKGLNRLSPTERDARINTMASEAQVQLPARPLGKYSPCSWDQLRDLADSGLVEVGSHTRTHPILSSISDEESRRELGESRAEIEAGIQGPVRSFCFPNGTREDYRLSQVRQIQEAGYDCAVTALPGPVEASSDRYQLPRIGVGPESDELTFSKAIDGLNYYRQKVARVFR